MPLHWWPGRALPPASGIMMLRGAASQGCHRRRRGHGLRYVLSGTPPRRCQRASPPWLELQGPRVSAGAQALWNFEDRPSRRNELACQSRRSVQVIVPPLALIRNRERRMRITNSNLPLAVFQIMDQSPFIWNIDLIESESPIVTY